ncbi:MAG: transposase [Acidobacteria bacterium]|nr:transposase [Acidobacteriota bacterium]MBE3134812.1 transposase [Acidobacteriota bacterium]
MKLSQLEGVQVQAVAHALEIHPFMLSRWRKEAREGVLREAAPLPVLSQTRCQCEIRLDDYSERTGRRRIRRRVS